MERHGQVHLHRPQLLRPRRRDRLADPEGADHLHEADQRAWSAATTRSCCRKGSVKSDWEVELGVVIGTKARYVEKADALKYVAGYCVVNDVSEREYQLERGGTWDKGKGCDTFGPVGPWLVTADEVRRPAGARDVARRQRPAASRTAARRR